MKFTDEQLKRASKFPESAWISAMTVRDLAQEILDLRWSLTVHKMFNFSVAYGAMPDTIQQAFGSSREMARAHAVVTFAVADARDPATHKFWIEVLKSRRSNTSKHAFKTFDDAVAFLKGVVGW